MSMFKKPYERDAKQTLNVLIYGRPGIGKTTLACSAPNVFLIDFDRGIDRVDAQYQANNIFEPTRWEELGAAVQELANTPEAKTIVIDTIGKLLDLAVDYIRRTKPSLIQNDGTPSLKGYGMRNQLFKEFLSNLNAVGKSVVFVSHEVEEKQKINREEVTTMRPNITGGNRNEVVQDLDLLGYMQVVNGQRTITFDQNENIIAKNSRNIHGQWNAQLRCYMPIEIPMLGDNVPNDFLTREVFERNTQFLTERLEKMSDYGDLVKVLEAMVSECESAEQLNDVCAKVGGKDFVHLFDSKLRARVLITDRAKQLNLKFNAKTKQYESVQS